MTPLTIPQARALAIIAGREAGFIPPHDPVLDDLEWLKLVDDDGNPTLAGHVALKRYRRAHGLPKHKGRRKRGGIKHRRRAA